IQTNVQSLIARQNLAQNTSDLQGNQEKLSSGLRINSAADDPAGLAISNRFTAQIRGQNQAVRNAQDGISLVQTAEGAMQETTNILQRMREIAVQSANETNTDSDRESLNQEYSEIRDELDRIANSTTFNGQNLLDGSRGTAQFQVGANSSTDNQISVDLSTSTRSEDIGKRFDGTLNFS
ncbi:MAG: flagellin, partial [Thiohalorhabdaceae bacterium]